MKISEKINEIKANITPDDLAKYKRDIALYGLIKSSFDSSQDLVKFLLLANVHTIHELGIDLDDFIADLKRGGSAFKELNDQYKKESGH